MKTMEYHPEPLIAMIQHRLWEKDLNFIMGVTGDYGSGKTCAAQWFCEEVDPKFNINRVVFSAEDFIELLLTRGKDELKKGSAVLYEEASVSAVNRLWYSKVNLALTSAIDTMRYRNFLLVFTTPFKGNLDKRIRQGLHAVVNMVGEPNRKERYSTAKYRLVKVNELYGRDGWTYYPRINTEGIFGTGRLDEIQIPKSKDKLENQIKRKKDEFLREHFSTSLEELKQLKLSRLGIKDRDVAADLSHFTIPKLKDRDWGVV